MSLVLAIILAFTVLESPWRWVAIGVGLLWEGFEIYVYLRWRKVKSMTGHEALVGTRGVAMTELDPKGQAKIKGQIWSVTSTEVTAKGEPVVVTEVEGLHLTVEPVEVSDAAREIR